MKKIKGIFMLLILSGSASFAQTLSEAIRLTNNEQFEKADAMFKSLIQAQPNNGEYLFYYGENFFKNENPDKANEQYQKAIDVNATSPFGYVGVGKIQWYAGKQTEAKATFYKATTLAAGKNASVLMKIAEAYTNAEVKNLADASTLLAQAAKLEPKNPEVYILLGDVYLEQNDGTKAIENYEKAGALDPKSVRAILKQGQVWNRAKNYTLAIDTYKKALKIDSTFAPAYLEMSEIYLRAGLYQNAYNTAKKYIELNNDCSALSRYAGKANLAKKYKESVEGATQALQCDPNNAYTYRYKGRSEYELGDYANGIQTFTTFFDMAAKNPSLKISPEDYEYLGKLYAKNGKDSLAIINFKKALELQPEKVELNGDIAASYVKLKKYAEAIEAYKAKIQGGKGNANDQFGIGRAYYFGKDFINADSSFAKVITAQPELAIGYFWRARAKSQQDPKNEKWLAKDDFEMFISKVKPEEAEKNKKELIEAYNYLSAYYADKARNDCPNVKKYMQKILELDPANAQAKKVLAGLKC
jgi:tetratricopeptide (TPR) repeat protein